MLAITDPRWATLHSNFASGAVVRDLLEKFLMGEVTPDEQELLWQALCHQYTASEAGYAAIPYLILVSRSYSDHKALESLDFAAYILACSNVPTSDPIPGFLAEGFEKALPDGLDQVSNLATKGEFEPLEIRCLLATMAAFLGSPELYFLLEDADSPLVCHQCQTEIYPLDEVSNFLKPGE